MTKYRVSCYSPPSALKLDERDKVKVVGRVSGKNMTAFSIANISKKISTCNCDQPAYIASVKLAEVDTVSGVASNITILSSGIEFDLTI